MSEDSLNRGRSDTKGAPLYFLQDDERLTATAQREPVIPVIKISLQPADLSNRFNSITGSKRLTVTALIDTGADGMYIDSDFAERNGFQSSHTATVSSASLTREEKVYPALFQLPDSSSHSLQTANFIASPLRANGRKYDAILGMMFLSNGILTMDFDSHIYRFEYTTKPNK